MKTKEILQKHEERISSNEELLRFFKDEVATKKDLANLKEEFFTKIDDFVGMYMRIDTEQVAVRYHLDRNNRNFEKIEGKLGLGLEF